jgi:hypothetical protein
LRVTARCPDASTITHDYVLDFQADAEATYLPRLWAAQQIQALATTISVEAEKTERAKQQQELARSHQVLVSPAGPKPSPPASRRSQRSKPGRLKRAWVHA